MKYQPYGTKEELEQLVAAQETENLYLEFKGYHCQEGKLPVKDRDELIKEIAAFANAEGGSIILGIHEDKERRVAARLEDIGITIGEFDEMVMAVQQSLFTKVRPRVHGVQYQKVSVNEDKIAVVIHVPRSYIKPHALTTGSMDTFPMRHPGGVTYMSVDDIRRTVLGSNLLGELQAFRKERVEKLLDGSLMYLPMKEGALLLLHIIPLWSLVPGNRIDIKDLVSKKDDLLFPPFGDGGDRYNADGYIICAQEGKCMSHYTEVLRSGIIEMCEQRMMNFEEGVIYDWGKIESGICNKIFEYIDFLRKKEVPPPFYMCIDILRAKGFVSGLERWNTRTLDRDYITSGLVMYEEGDVTECVIDIFDSLATAFGWPQSYLGRKKRGTE